MLDIMAVVHQKIRSVFSDKNLSLRQASLKCDIKYSTLHSMLNDEREVSYSILDAICSGLNISMAYFSSSVASLDIDGFASHDAVYEKATDILDRALKRTSRNELYRGHKIGLEDFLNWWFANSGRLESFEGLAQHVDIFKPPNKDSQRIRPTTIGKLSLASKYFFLEEVDHLHQTLDGFSKQANDALVKAHLDALNRGEPVITHPSLDEKLRDGRRFTRQYRRVLAPVYLPKGEPMIINYSQDFRVS